MKIRKRVIWWAKFKDFFTTKVPSLPMCPAPCPYCGAVVQVPLSRWVMENTCEVCESVYYSIGVGIVD